MVPSGDKRSLAHLAMGPVCTEPLAAGGPPAGAEVVNRAELVAGLPVPQEQGAHPKACPFVVPPGVESARSRTLVDGSMEQMDRVPRPDPTEDPVVGYRFRDEFGAALAAASAGVILAARYQMRPDLFDVKRKVKTAVGVKEGCHLPPGTRGIALPDPVPRDPGKIARPSQPLEGRGAGTSRSPGIHSDVLPARTDGGSWQVSLVGV